jgi:hypothetical protein
MCRNKHLKGVWRLPTFITLAGATHDEGILSNRKGEAVNGTDSSTALPSTGSPPARLEPSLPPPSNQSNNSGESHTKEPIRNHHQQVGRFSWKQLSQPKLSTNSELFTYKQQQRVQPRHLYSDSLKASNQNAPINRSVLREGPTPQQQYHSPTIQRQNDDDSLSSQSAAYRRGNGSHVRGERDPIRGPQYMHHASIDRHRGDNI